MWPVLADSICTCVILFDGTLETPGTVFTSLPGSQVLTVWLQKTKAGVLQQQLPMESPEKKAQIHDTLWSKNSNKVSSLCYRNLDACYHSLLSLSWVLQFYVLFSLRSVFSLQWRAISASLCEHKSDRKEIFCSARLKLGLGEPESFAQGTTDMLWFEIKWLHAFYLHILRKFLNRENGSIWSFLVPAYCLKPTKLSE